MNLVVFSPSAFPQEQARFNNSVSPTMFGASSQLQATQASPQQPLPGQRVITPATVANLLNPAAGSASVNATVMDTLVDSTSQETQVELLRQNDHCSGRINESTGQGSLTQLPMIPPAAQTVESQFAATEHGVPGINTSLAIASVDDPEGGVRSYSVLPVENEGVGLPNMDMVCGDIKLGAWGNDSGRHFDGLLPPLPVDHEKQRYPEVVSDFGDKAFFNEQEISLFSDLGAYLSMEEIKLLLSDGPCFRIGVNELITPAVGTLFESVSSSSEPGANCESAANNNDTGYMLNAESVDGSTIEPMPQVIKDLPSVCSFPAFPVMLTDSAENAQQRIPDTQDRERPGSAKRQLNRTTKKKSLQLRNPGRFILGFLLEELSLPDDKRIIHWVSKELGVFSKEHHVNHELARRWGVRKKNKKMTYESLHRAIRCNYGKKGKAGNIEHLVFGIDGQSPPNAASPLYQFNMSSVSVKALFNLSKKSCVIDE